MIGRRLLFSVTVWFVASAGVACGATPSATPTSMTHPATLDTAISRTTDQGVFQVSYTSELDPPTINTVHTWTVHVATPDGQPVEGARVTMEGGMPEHNHGMPTMPQVTATSQRRLPSGRHEVPNAGLVDGDRACR